MELFLVWIDPEGNFPGTAGYGKVSAFVTQVDADIPEFF
jgi:hypothetical protein